MFHSRLFSHAERYHRSRRIPHRFGAGQRRYITFIPRLILSAFRIPLAAAGAGIGISSYISYKVEKATTGIVPEWMSDALENANTWFKDLDFKDFHLPKFDLDPDDDDALTQWNPSQNRNEPLQIHIPLSISLTKWQEKFKSSTQGILDSKETSRPIGNQVSSVMSHVLSEPTGDWQQSHASQDVHVVPDTTDGDQHHFMGLTRKLIQIRNLLKNVNENSDSSDTSLGASTGIQLPSIVVIGSQSSGKSSVLESLVGHEFLPKGSNMVTRRPLEITLIHSPSEQQDYAEFPQLRLGKMKDWNKVSKTLTDLNLAVSDTECVSDIPIELNVYSPHVPDLQMIDLPGYIQIHSKNQPPELKEKIRSLCDKYVQEPNIILAVSAADVDLANSEALKASRRADPRGERTIGIVTKMDLVEPNMGIRILKNNEYPLRLGYIGVANRPSADKSSQALIRAEQDYFNQFSEYKHAHVGKRRLQKTLIDVLEGKMRRDLSSITERVQNDLEETRYQFKVQYNDMPISPESYVADAVDVLKQRFKAFVKEFDRPQIKNHIRDMLQERIWNIVQDVYWKDDNFAFLPSQCSSDYHWANKLDLSSSKLTRSGIGKSTVSLVSEMLQTRIQDIASDVPWGYHTSAKQIIQAFSKELIQSKVNMAIDQVENTIKPFKFEVDCTESEWMHGQQIAIETMEARLQVLQKKMHEVKATMGRRRLRQAWKHLVQLEHEKKNNPLIHELDETESNLASSSLFGFSGTQSFPFLGIFSSSSDSDTQFGNTTSYFELQPQVLDKARDAAILYSQIKLLQQRLMAIKSSKCSSPSQKTCCPEIFLSVVAEKLTQTAVMFISVELLNDFFFMFPREVDQRLYYGLSREQLIHFAKENPNVKRHIELQERKMCLEEAMRELRGLRYDTRDEERGLPHLKSRMYET